MTTKTDITLPDEFRSANSVPVDRATIKRERMIEILQTAVEADRRAQMNDNAACASKLSESDKQDQSRDAAKMVPSDDEAAALADQCGVYYDEDPVIAGNHARVLLSRYNSSQPAASADLHVWGYAVINPKEPSWPHELAIDKSHASRIAASLYASKIIPLVAMTDAPVAQEPGDLPLPFEQALSELIDNIVPGLDTGDILADARQASAALSLGVPAAQEPVAIPEGWRGVPVEPTEEMLTAGVPENAVLDPGTALMFRNGRISTWRHMVGAAPAAPVAAQAQPCNHVFEARPIDGTNRANVSCEPVCRKCGYRPAARAAKGVDHA